MKITAPGTDNSFSGDAQYLDDDAITKLNLCEFTQKQVRNTIDNLIFRLTPRSSSIRSRRRPST